MCICSSRCVYGMAHCKVKSSDDIIINVLETDSKTKMHSWGCATWDGVCANASFSQVKNLKQYIRNL